MKKFIPLFGLILALSPLGFSQASLSQLLEELVVPLDDAPVDTGADWRRWEAAGTAWDTVLSTADSTQKQTGVIVAMQDTLPVLGLFAGKHSEWYEYVKVGERLAEGWTITARASAADGRVDWVEMKNGQDRFIVTAQPGTAVPQFLIWPGGDGSCLILSWDATGEVFESILLYDLQKRSLLACSPFALNTTAMDYLFVKGKDSTWVEYTFRADAEQPVALAIHEEVPGKLSAAAWDFNRDGRMDLLGDFSAPANQLTFRQAPAAMKVGAATEIKELRKTLAARARETNGAWLRGQWAWMRVRPLGVNLPKVKAD
jgi:hypothetical protein